jgi:RNA polymerase sigma-70 factor (ECF subfamily)
MTITEFNTRIVQERSSLKSFAISLTRNTDDAADLLQDTYVKALRYRSKFRDNTNLRAWMFTIMKNTFINNHRRTAKTRTFMSRGDAYVFDRGAMNMKTESSESKMNAKEIVRHITLLEDDYRIPFTKFYLGFKYEEIASQLQLPLGTVKSRIFIARKILGAKLLHFQ